MVEPGCSVSKLFLAVVVWFCIFQPTVFTPDFKSLSTESDYRTIGILLSSPKLKVLKV